MPAAAVVSKTNLKKRVRSTLNPLGLERPRAGRGKSQGVRLVERGKYEVNAFDALPDRDRRLAISSCPRFRGPHAALTLRGKSSIRAFRAFDLHYHCRGVGLRKHWRQALLQMCKAAFAYHHKGQEVGGIGLSAAGRHAA